MVAIEVKLYARADLVPALQRNLCKIFGGASPK